MNDLKIPPSKGLWERSVVAVLVSKRLIIRSVITLIVLAIFIFLLYLLFYKKIDNEFKDLINVAIGAFLASFGRIIDFWFHKDEEDAKEDKADPLNDMR